jgi:hypothetical protein
MSITSWSHHTWSLVDSRRGNIGRSYSESNVMREGLCNTDYRGLWSVSKSFYPDMRVKPREPSVAIACPWPGLEPRTSEFKLEALPFWKNILGLYSKVRTCCNNRHYNSNIVWLWVTWGRQLWVEACNINASRQMLCRSVKKLVKVKGKVVSVL